MTPKDLAQLCDDVDGFLVDALGHLYDDDVALARQTAERVAATYPVAVVAARTSAFLRHVDVAAGTHLAALATASVYRNLAARSAQLGADSATALELIDAAAEGGVPDLVRREHAPSQARAAGVAALAAVAAAVDALSDVVVPGPRELLRGMWEQAS